MSLVTSLCQSINRYRFFWRCQVCKRTGGMCGIRSCDLYSASALRSASLNAVLGPRSSSRTMACIVLELRQYFNVPVFSGSSNLNPSPSSPYLWGGPSMGGAPLLPVCHKRLSSVVGCELRSILPH